MKEKTFFLRTGATAVFLLTLSCAPASITLSKEDRSQLSRQGEIGAVHHTPAPFYADAGAYGLVGYGMSVSAGKQIIKRYGLEDPAAAVEASFLRALEKEFSGIKVRAVDRPVADDDLAAVKRAYGGAWVFDFKTIGWGSAVEGDVEFTLRARLIRNGDSKVVWQGTCKYETKSVPTKLLTGRSPALLKKKFEAGVAPCANDLWSRFQAER